MAKQIKTKVNYQMTELVNNLNEAATATSEQKRDFHTTRALYNAKRLERILSAAKIGAMALVMAFGMVACGQGEASTETTTTDSTAVTTDSTSAPVADSTPTVADSTDAKGPKGSKGKSGK